MAEPRRLWLFGDSVNTDDILPGRFAPFMVGEDGFHRYAFAHLRPGFAAGVRPGDLLVGGRNWGLGSSREYAPQALKRLGVGAVIARSFARIHFRNLLNLGIPAFTSDEVPSALAAADGESAEFDVANGTLDWRGRRFELTPPPEFLRAALSEGSILDYYRKHRRLPGELRGPDMTDTIETPYGAVTIDTAAAELGELVVTDEGVELEVVGLEPLRFEPAPEEEEDWGE